MAARADEYIDSMMEDKILPALRESGYKVRATEMTELLDDDERHIFEIQPPKGADVCLVAIGDIDSNDVDMFVYDGETGALVVKDELVDDMPVCAFIARGGVTYRVSILVVDTDAPAFVKFVYSLR
jgi:hypothetical protein